MNVLSLFDGISCGRVAMEVAGISVESYFASEIDSQAIKVASKNFPTNVNLGDVKDWKNWGVPWDEIDIVIGGSPCQGFSVAGEGRGFSDPRSQLFFDYADILHFVKSKNPKIKFLLENVVMRGGDQDVISENLGVEPVFLDSQWFSAQMRKRLYWFNWDMPKFLAEPNESSFQVLKEQGAHLDAFKVNRTASREKMWKKGCPDITNAKKSRCLTTKQDRAGNAGLIKYGDFCRYLTPLECERLQGLQDGYTEGVSNTARYRALGNGWSIPTVAKIFEGVSN